MVFSIQSDFFKMGIRLTRRQRLVSLPAGRSNFINKAGVRKKSDIRARPITIEHISPISDIIR